jgi:hypothetical protein
MWTKNAACTVPPPPVLQNLRSKVLVAWSVTLKAGGAVASSQRKLE